MCVLWGEMPIGYGECMAIFGWNLNRQLIHRASAVGLWLAELVRNLFSKADHKAIYIYISNAAVLIKICRF